MEELWIACAPLVVNLTFGVHRLSFSVHKYGVQDELVLFGAVKFTWGENQRKTYWSSTTRGRQPTPERDEASGLVCVLN